MTTPRDVFEAEVNKELAERVTRLREVLEQGLADLISPIHVNPPEQEAREHAAPLSSLLRFLDLACAAGSQREILEALLDVSTSCFPRTVLFILRSGALVAWNARNIEGARVEGVAHLTIPANGEHLPARALASGRMVTAGASGPGFVLTEALGGVSPARSAAVPLVVRGRCVAVLYGDSGSGGTAESESVFPLLGPIGSLSIEALGSTRRERIPRSARGGADRGISTAAPAREATAGPATALHPDAEDRAAVDYDLSDDDVSSTAGTPRASVPPPAPEEAEMQALLGDIEDMRRESPGSQLSPDDQRTQADARRFASLLISEILLYNEEAVILGRRNHDLTKRLGREIEKSRQAFATRVPHHLAGAGRYFDEELVRVLAEGDPSVLGN